MIILCLHESADTFFLDTKTHNKRCNCDIIKGRLYVVLALTSNLTWLKGLKVPSLIAKAKNKPTDK